MNEREALLKAIGDQPTEVTPRLIYADWLEEHGKKAHEIARAEFIRASIEWENLAEDDPRRFELGVRIGELQKAHEKKWLKGIPKWATEIGFHRGFLETIVCTPEQFINDSASTFAQEPVHSAMLTAPRGTGVGQALAECPFLERLDQLHLGSVAALDPVLSIVQSPHVRNLKALSLENLDFDEQTAQKLCDAKHLKNLESLGLSPRTGFTIAGLQLLAKWPQLKKLTEFVFTASWIGAEGIGIIVNSDAAKYITSLNLNSQGSHYTKAQDDGAVVIAESKNLGRLQKLSVFWNEISDRGIAALAGGKCLKNLKHLNLGNNRVHAEGMEALAATKVLVNLTHLNFSDNYLHDASVIAFAKSRSFNQLNVLNLRDNRFGSEAVKALAESPCLANLVELDLGNNQFAAEAIEALAASGNFAKLRELRLSDNHIGAQGMAALAASPHLTGLVKLNLEQCRIGASGTQAMGNSTNFLHVRSLNLQHNSICDEGAAALAASPNLSALESLEIGANGIGVEGAKALAGSAFFERLKFLRLSHNRPTEEGKMPLKERFGKRVVF